MVRQRNPRQPKPIAERFYSHVDKDGPVPEHCPELGPCWEWTGSLNQFGYARFYVTTAPYERESFGAPAPAPGASSARSRPAGTCRRSRNRLAWALS